MAAIPKAFDVWFVAANTVYKAVPYNIVADWTQQGRLSRSDKVRPAGTTTAWVAVGDNELLADYLARPSAAITAPAALPVPESEDAAPAEALPAEAAPVELPDPEPGARVRRPEDDDEVDMIPLIDISMVLLVFFIMIQASGALAPVDVPEMKYAGQLTNDPDAITITIEKLNTEDVYYSVRVGNVAPKPSQDMLQRPEDALKALNEALVGTTRPPEVRIACRKDLPRERVYELRRELEPLRKKGIINSTVATVVEAPEK
ncbi:biopolymer transporter ExbD [Gemmata sp. G18]|uniref:Biopolymer transporter ExbD n=1 Tax=Gemmata palustris TaxID=2822762 RepID=A0ABS5BS87_9BACT|nr:biopolymer transporter ExbD [Gemmata palustris]MBP3956602.1 biopolymer transporter ExbD [Gemmata palustris]